MKLQEILQVLEEKYPLASAEEWDNPGLIVGRRNAEVQRVLVSLDVTSSVIEEALAWKADLILSHHPLIFRGIKKVSGDDFTGRRILQLAENGMAVYAMHTNFDIRKMGDLNAAQLQLINTRVLDVTGLDQYDLEEGLGKVGELSRPMPLSEFALFVKKQMGVDEVRCYGAQGEDPEIRKVAVCGGSGRSTIPCAIEQKAEVLVTGDIDYHTALDAGAQGLYLVDAGHFGTERCFISHMVQELGELFPALAVQGSVAQPPFQAI